MNHRRTSSKLLLGAALACAASAGTIPAAHAQGATPSPLRIVVPYPPGGGSDRAARLIADALAPRLGAPVVVENVTGAGGRLALRQLAGQPDANVVVLANPALMVVAPLVYRNNGYDPDRDFQPLTQVSSYEFAAAVAGAVPVREFAHLTAWMRVNPDKATVGVPATGSLPHFFALMVGQASKAPVQAVGYRGSAPLAADLVGGHLPVAMDTLESLLPMHEAGKLRILATSGEHRAVKSIPTFRESGFPIVATGWNVMYAKAGMPAERADRIAREVAAVMAQPDIREKFSASRNDPVSADRAQTRRMLDAFKAQWVPVIRQSGLQFD